MKMVEAIVRTERVENVVAALRDAGVPRLTLSHVHALGSGVDPGHYRLSLESGAAYTEKVRLEIICPTEDSDRLVRVIRRAARTGERGDGIIAVLEVERCLKIRTGDEDRLALL